MYLRKLFVKRDWELECYTKDSDCKIGCTYSNYFQFIITVFKILIK